MRVLVAHEEPETTPWRMIELVRFFIELVRVFGQIDSGRRGVASDGSVALRYAVEGRHGAVAAFRRRHVQLRWRADRAEARARMALSGWALPIRGAADLRIPFELIVLYN
jgi:hypothetical protein